VTARGGSPAVSVVIPCFNQARFLVDALASVTAQGDVDHEVIVVDDGSRDDAAEVSARFARVRCLRQENQGTATARNQGLRVSRGRHLLFLDADDRLLPGALAVGVDALERNPECGFVYGHVRLFGSASSDCRCPTQSTVDRSHYRELLARNYIWTPGAVMYRRMAIEEVGGFDPRAGGSADFDLNIRIARRWPVRCHGHTVLEYREHADSQSGDVAYMLRSAVSVRRRHRRTARPSRDERAALAAGIRAAQADYGERLLDRMAGFVRRGDWRRALGCLAPLVCYHPGGLPRRVVRRLSRS
jgi:glycosyltransferase involved in cell wall biosynthesis